MASVRDAMKIFVGNVDDRTTQEELSELFEKYGTVVSCAVMKQYAFVHMRGSDRAMKAIEELNGRELHGKKMVVELSKPRPQNTWKIFVGNVGPGYDAAELRTLFEEYGKVIECDVVKDYAFVHMERESEAREAIDKLNGTEIRGKRINVEMSNKARPMSSNGSSHSGRSRRSHEYRDAPQSRSETYNRRRASEAAYASYALKSPYERYESARYDSRVRPPSPMYYSRDRSPLRRSPTRSYYEGAMASAALASKYRSATSDYSSLSSAYGVQTTPSFSSAFSSQTYALSSAYASRAPTAGTQSGYESQPSAYAVDPSSYNTQAAAAYRPQGPALTTGYATQVPSVASAYSTQTPAHPYGSISTTATAYAPAAALGTAYRQPQTSAYDPSQMSGLGAQPAYSTIPATNEALMYERTCLSPPRSNAPDSFKKAADAYKRLAPDRRYAEIADYRRLAQKPQDSYHRSPPKSNVDFRRPAETQSDYQQQYAAYNDYLRAAQVAGYQRRM